MSDGKYPIISINYETDNDLNYSKKKSSKEFNFQKFEKFKSKDENYYKMENLKGAENKVKNLLSLFIKNYEIEKENSDIFNENKSLKSKEINTNNNKNKKKVKKVLTVTDSKKKNKLLRSGSFNISLNNNINGNRNHKIINASEGNNHIHIQKKKVAFNLKPIKHPNNNELYKDLNYNRIKSKKSMLNQFIEKTKTFGSNLIKRNKTGIKADKKDNNILHRNSNPNIEVSNTIKSNSLIKKTKSSYKNDNYINFKNDNISINNINKGNSITLKSSLKKKKCILKNKKKLFKNEIYNDSNYNSLFSDLSENYLNKKSEDIKGNYKERDLMKKDKTSSLVFSNKSIQKNLTHFLNFDSSDITSKNSSIIGNSLSPKRMKRSFWNSSKTKDKFKRATTSVSDIMKHKSSKINRFDTQIKNLKQMIKKSLILRPEELDIVKNEEKNDSKKNTKKKAHKMNSFVLNYKSTLKLLNKNSGISKSNKNLTKIPPVLNDLMKEENNTTKSNELINISHNHLQDITKEENKKDETAENLESKKTIKSTKSMIDSSKNSSYEDFSTYSIQRKKNIYYQKYRVLTHKKLVYDSLDDEEFEDEEEINSFYLDPNSTFTILFDSILFIFTIISLFENPLYLAMTKNFCRPRKITLSFFINSVIDLLYMLDLILGFFRAYYNWEEQLIKKNKIIAFKYLTGWFLFDLISSIPIYSLNSLYQPVCLENEISSKYSNTVLNNLQYLLISNRLFKVFKIFWYNQAWKIVFQKLSDYGSILVTISLVLASINYTACLYIFIARNSFPNWIFKANLDTKSFVYIYICAIYILIMAVTTVGYGDITCYSLNETIFQLLILIIGIIGYSLVISLISNYIKKINEKSVDFEQKKDILDEIRISYKNLPDELYDRILRYLKFKNFEEKKFKNIIFDCLPVGLKNNLISEMYKPIIKNFLFFKNFQNTDFIVQVILAFKPILAFKNDILVNEGDMVEDIMFVKKGVLSVELPINIANPQENIDKYLIQPLLTTDKGQTLQSLKNNSISTSNKDLTKNNSFYNNSQSFLQYNSTYSTKYSQTFNIRLTKLEQERKEREEREIERRKNLTYVKIVGIRENEHFGDVLMFLEQRSPLRVRVRSVKSELFFLKKIDAVKISTKYQNIWKRINKKSVFNFEQMKKSIKNIVEIYCAVKKFDSHKNKGNNHMKNLKRNSSIIYNANGIKLNLSNSRLNTINEEEQIKKSSTAYNYRKNSENKINYAKFFKNAKINDDILLKDNFPLNFYSSAKNLNRSIHFNSPKSLLTFPSLKIKAQNKNTNIYPKLSYNNKQMKFGQKVADAFNRNFKFYKGTNKNNIKGGKNETIISEETEQEGTVENGLNTIIKTSIIPHLSTKIYSSRNINKTKISNKNVNINKNSYINKFKTMENTNFEDNIEYETYFNKEINEELNNSEEIRVVKEENLLDKKLDLDLISTKPSEINNNSFEYRNSKLQLLLKSFDEDDDNPQRGKNMNIHNNENIINEKSNENISSSSSSSIHNKSNKNIIYNLNKNLNNINESSENYASPINSKIDKSTKALYTSNILSINSNISFNIESSYENCNVISGSLLIKSKKLQNKLKNYLMDEIQAITESEKINSTSYLKKLNTLQEPTNFSDFQTTKFISYKNQERNVSTQITHRKNKFKDKNSGRELSHSASMNENFIQSNKNIEKIGKIEKINSNKFQTGIGKNLMFNNLFENKTLKKKKSQKELVNKNTNKVNIINNNINYINNSIIDFQKKRRIKKNSSMIDNFLRPKKKDNLLSQINFNIQQTNQNLNNPEEFYSSYFNSLLEGKINKDNKGRRNTIFFAPNRKDNLFKDKPKIKNKNNIYKTNQ